MIPGPYIRAYWTQVVFLDTIFGSGSWIRTNDLRVMSPTSFHCSIPRYAYSEY